MSALPSESREHDFFVYMHGSHAVLEELFGRVMAAVRTNDRVELQRLWCIGEARLLAHLEAEERYILPVFGRTDRREALELLRDHAKIRELVLELGIAVELHYIRAEQLEHFANMLRAHAAREELLLYRWGSQLLEAGVVDAAQRFTDHAGAQTRAS